MIGARRCSISIAVACRRSWKRTSGKTILRSSVLNSRFTHPAGTYEQALLVLAPPVLPEHGDR